MALVKAEGGLRIFPYPANQTTRCGSGQPCCQSNVMLRQSLANHTGRSIGDAGLQDKTQCSEAKRIYAHSIPAAPISKICAEWKTYCKIQLPQLLLIEAREARVWECGPDRPLPECFFLCAVEGTEREWSNEKLAVWVGTHHPARRVLEQ